MNHLNSKTQGSALFNLIGGIAILAAVLALLVKLAGSGYYSDAAEMTKAAVTTRIMPAGQNVVGAPKDEPPPAPTAAPAPAAASDAATAASGAAASATADAGSTAAPAAGGADSAQAKANFEKTCQACHGANSPIPGAPKVTHNDEWAPRIKQGKDTLHQHAINGFNAMPPKGGNLSYSDDEVKAIVDYMVSQSGG